MSAVQSRAKPGQKIWNLAIHAELHRAVKIAAIMENVTMSEKLHAILCREFNRTDLMKSPQVAS